MQYDDLMERQLSTEEIFNGRLLQVYRDAVALPDGSTAGREYIRHVGAVCVVAVTDQGQVVVERQCRYPMGKVVLEIPAGKLDSKEEDPLSAVRRELREETGAEAKNWISLGEFYPTPAYSDEVIHMYLATGLSFGEAHRDNDEFLSVELIPFDELVNEIQHGRVPDGKTQAAVLRAAYHFQP